MLVYSQKKGKPVEFDVLYNSVGEVINFKTLYMDNISDVSSIQALKKIGDHCNFSCEFFDISEYSIFGKPFESSYLIRTT